MRITHICIKVQFISELFFYYMYPLLVWLIFLFFLIGCTAEFDRHELQIYEEVACMPPFQRKTLVLIGAQGVGRRSLKNRLVVLHPTRFGTTVPREYINVETSPLTHIFVCIFICLSLNSSDTSRRPRDDERDGQSYRFVTRLEMEMDIRAGRYLEHGEYDGNLYGTKIDSIHEVVNNGRTCILDVNPQVSNPEQFKVDLNLFMHVYTMKACSF